MAPAAKKRRAAQMLPDEVADLVGLIVDVPGHIFQVSIPGLFYKGKIISKDRERRGAVVVKFDEDPTRYWFPAATVRQWLADMTVKGRSATSPSIEQDADEFAASVLMDMLIQKHQYHQQKQHQKHEQGPADGQQTMVGECVGTESAAQTVLCRNLQPDVTASPTCSAMSQHAAFSPVNCLGQDIAIQRCHSEGSQPAMGPVDDVGDVAVQTARYIDTQPASTTATQGQCRQPGSIAGSRGRTAGQSCFGKATMADSDIIRQHSSTLDHLQHGTESVAHARKVTSAKSRPVTSRHTVAVEVCAGVPDLLAQELRAELVASLGLHQPAGSLQHSRCSGGPADTHSMSL